MTRKYSFADEVPVLPSRPALTGKSWGRLLQWILAGLAIATWIMVYRSLEPLSNWIVYDLLRMQVGSHLASSVQFFLYDAPKVILLLTAVVFGVGVIQTFFTPERTRRILAGKRETTGNVFAGLLGIVTPFCSCSAVPLFIGFVKAGVPLGVTLSFLISAPMVNEVALALLFGLFGWRVALLYLATGLFIAIVSGWILGRMRLERWVESWVHQVTPGLREAADETSLTWSERIGRGRAAVQDIVGRVWPYVMAGIAVGAAIHGYVPEGFMASIMGKGAWWSVPLAVLLGIPMYSNAAGILPIVQALLGKGAALGTVLAFMMAVIGLSLPEMIILRKVLKVPLIVTFAAVVGFGIMVVGYLFNILI